MNKTKPLQIFRAGNHTSNGGDALAFSEADLTATAAAYDPAKHEAPIVIGHPKLDAPAYGWVRGLAAPGGALEATPGDVDPAFAELVAAGRFKKISASFYAPDSPSNPVPGVYYLRHVGFLGAHPPSVKGLRAPEFADGETGVVEFGDYADVVTASTLRRLRDWVIGKFGLDEADKALPDYSIASLESAARQSDADGTYPQPGFSEAPSLVPPVNDGTQTMMTPEEKAEFERLKAQNAQLQAGQQAVAASLRKQTTAEFTEFLGAQVKAGKLLPAEQAGALAFMETLHDQVGTVEFGEGAAKATPVAWFKGFVAGLKPRVEFGERAPREQTQHAQPMSTVAGFSVNPERAQLHEQALAYAEANGVDYVTAVLKVGG